MAIARYYTGGDQQSTIADVPLRDLEDEEFDEYPKWVQESIDASSLYRKSRPHAAPAKQADTPVKPAEQKEQPA